MAVLFFVIMVSSTLISSCLASSSTELSPSPVSYCDRQYSCLNCSAVRVCAPTPDKQHLYEISRFTCGSSNPYCNYATGSCSSTLDEACYDPTPNVTVSANFTCMRDGYFPDPKNCSLYYYCQNEVPYQYTCTDPTPYYHPGYKYCVTSRYYCTDYSTSYQCNYGSNYGKRVTISYTNNYFLVCGTNNNIIAVDKCIGDYYFSSSYQTCLFTCPNKGLFLRDDDCANYFKCSVTRVGYLQTNMTCPIGQAFLESEFSCVDRSRVPNCNYPSPDLYSK